MERLVNVDLGLRSYEVRVGPGLLAELGETVREQFRPSSVVVISDDAVASIYGEACLASLRNTGLRAEMLTFPAGEPSKTLDTYAGLMDGLLGLDDPIDRDTAIVALGGGVAGDLAGFVAATALRGLRLVQCPTSLLACVDSSVGGKTGVDHAAGKNLIGAFHQPSAVLIDTEALRTLPEAEVRNGLAECVKHAVIRDPKLLRAIADRASDILSCDSEAMVELVARNVAIKAAVVSADEREQGVRADLNYGHTVGHAIETHLGYDAIRHGEAVSLGMIAENEIALSRGMLARDEAGRIRHALEALGLPTRRAGLDGDALWSVMRHDKKARCGAVRFVLPRSVGQVEIVSDVDRGEASAALEALA